MKRIKRTLTGVLLVAILLCNTSITTFAAWDMLQNVPRYCQEKSNWCWAAAALMAGKYKYPASTATQPKIVAHVKGNSTVNDTASIFETVNATEYVTNDTIELSTTLISPWNFSQVRTSIEHGFPVIPLAVKGLVNGHFYVIIGCNPSTNSIRLIDPSNGVLYTCSWSEFSNGTWPRDSRPHSFTVYFDEYARIPAS